MAIVPVQRGELRGADPAGEHVVVVARDRHHRQDLAVLRIYRDSDRLREPVLVDAFPKLGVEQLLQTVIDREDDRVPDRGPLKREGLDLTLGRIAFDLSPAVCPAQVLLVDLLDPGTSDVVVAEVASALEGLELLLGDRPGVAEHGGVERSVDVEADALGVDTDARKELGPLGEGNGELARHRRL